MSKVICGEVCSPSKVKEDLSDKIIKERQLIKAIRQIILEEQKSNILDNKSIEKSEQITEQAALNYYITKILGLSPLEFSQQLSYYFIRQTRIEKPFNRIIENATSKEKARCLFDNNRIFLYKVFPEFYNEYYGDPKPYEVFNCKDKTKASLIQYARTEDLNKQTKDTERAQLQNGKFSTAKSNQTKKQELYGAEIDRLIFWSMREIMEKACNESTEDVLLKLGTLNKTYSTKLGKVGCFSVIKARKIYDSALDFYFLNMPPQEQEQYFDFYIKLRRKCKIPESPEFTVRVYLYQKQRELIKDKEAEKYADFEMTM
jgi:hypothetical protein